MGRKTFWIFIAVISFLIIDLLLLSGGFFGFPLLMLILPLASLVWILRLFKTNEKTKQVAGCILLFLVGPIGFLISYCLFEAGRHSYEDIEQYGLPIMGLELACISFIFIVVGIILFFVGRSQAKKQKNQNTQ
jgi:hypothetical protein